MKTFLIAAVTQFVSYFLVVLNTRAYTQGLYVWTFLTDGFFLTQTFFVSKWMVEVKDARSVTAYFGFLVGGTAGSLAAILVTKFLYGR